MNASIAVTMLAQGTEPQSNQTSCAWLSSSIGNSSAMVNNSGFLNELIKAIRR